MHPVKADAGKEMSSTKELSNAAVVREEDVCWMIEEVDAGEGSRVVEIRCLPKTMSYRSCSPCCCPCLHGGHRDCLNFGIRRAFSASRILDVRQVRVMASISTVLPLVLVPRMYEVFAASASDAVVSLSPI